MAKIDNDGYFVLLLSIVILILTLGLIYIFLLIRIVYQAVITEPGSSRKGAYLVFGKKLVDKSLDLDYRQRLNRLVQLPDQCTILMGGITGNSGLSEAKAGYDFLLSQGITQESLFLEQASLNTLDNLKNARKILKSLEYKTAIIISNRYHLARCSIMAKSLKIEHDLCAAENSFTFNSRTLLKCALEAFYIHWFYIGKLWATCSRNQRMLEKIS